MSRRLRSRPKPRTADESLAAKFFHEAGVRGRCSRPMCAARAAQSHHVVYRQELRRRGCGEWNTRNAMGLCVLCHERHHNRADPLPLVALMDDHLAYAFEILGAYAYDYLKARYSGADPRMEEHLAAAS